MGKKSTDKKISELHTVEKNTMLEYCRFLFCLVILVWHIKDLSCFDKHSWFCNNGNYAVEFFAVLSGFLMAKSLAQKRHDDAIGSTISFLNRKWKVIAVANAIAFVIAFLTRNIVLGETIQSVIRNAFENIPDMMLLGTVGVGNTNFSYNGASWYLSAMFIVSIYLVPIYMKKPRLFRYFSFPCGLMLLGFLMQINGKLIATKPTFWGPINLGNIRIAGELLIGCSAFYVYDLLPKSIKIIDNGIKKNVLRLIVLGGILGYVFLCFFGIPNTCGPTLVLLLALLIIGAFICYGRSNSTFIRNLGERLGVFSMYIYLNHRYWIAFLNHCNLSLAPAQTVTVLVILTIVSAIVTELLTNWIIKRVSVNNKG